MVSAVTFIALLTFIFFDIYNLIPAPAVRYIVLTQFIPSFLDFFTSLSPAFYFFILIIILTLITGRAYCSFMCPLGIFQDIVIRVSSSLRKGKSFAFGRAYNFIRYGILSATAAVLIFTGTFFLLWFDPFSIYGRFAFYIVSPVIIKINNFIAVTMIKFNQYTLQAVEIKPVSTVPVIITLIIILLIVISAIFKGRLYCNTVCPVGALLGIISKISFLKITLNKDTCVNCGKCERVCKSSCIYFKEGTVDFTRCVLCFNCLAVCPNSSTGFSTAFPVKVKKDNFNQKSTAAGASFVSPVISRKNFLSGMVFLPAVVTLPSGKEQKLYFQDAAKQVQYKRKVFASPPGSVGIDEFNSRCTACSLCISRCPSTVLRPAVFQYGIYGMLQPFLDFSSGYCNYDCIICGQVCPTGAISKTDIAEKHLIRTGKSVFIKENCITYTNNTVCGACSEHCPTKAVHMIPFKKGLVIPEVDNSLCTGCGACEHVCPVRPFRAIYVDGIRKHDKAKLPVKKEDIKVETKKKAVRKEDFPF